jgi:hypothetical protein
MADCNRNYLRNLEIIKPKYIHWKAKYYKFSSFIDLATYPNDTMLLLYDFNRKFVVVSSSSMMGQDLNNSLVKDH